MPTPRTAHHLLEKALETVHKFKGNRKKAAEHLGMPVSTLQSQLVRAQQELPQAVLRRYEINASRGVGGNPRLNMTPEDAAVFWQAYKAAGFNKSALTQSTGMSRSAVAKRVQICERNHGYKVTPEEQASVAVPERSVKDEVALHKAREEARTAKARVKDAAARIAELEAQLTDYKIVKNSAAMPAEWTLRSRETASTDHIPCLFTSDFQLGEVVRAAETEHGYGYDSETFRRRYRYMIDTTIYLSLEHGGKDWTYPGLIYCRGGDTISGGIHEELAETDDLSPIEAVEVAFEEEAAGIAKLVDAFGRVDVKDCGGGNHDRTSKKPRSKGAYKNFDHLVSFMLQWHFRNEPRVTFQTTESMDVVFPIYGRNHLLTHGDRIGSRGGQGFIGPAATIMRGAQKVIQEQAALGRHIHMVMMGHFHTPLWMDWLIVNGSMPGYSEFAKMNRMRPHPPQQFLFYSHEKRGIVDIKPIILTEA